MGLKAGAPVPSEGGFARSGFVKTVGTASLFAGGVALGVELGGLGKSDMSVPEVSMRIVLFDVLCVYRLAQYVEFSSNPIGKNRNSIPWRCVE